MMIVEKTGSPVSNSLNRSVLPPRSWVVILGLVLLLGIGTTRIVTTYHVFGQTFDEPYHVAGGMEWWDLGKYQSERKEAPLGRIAAAFGPYLDGLRTIGHEYTPAGVLAEGNGILYSRNTYKRNLTLARL